MFGKKTLTTEEIRSVSPVVLAFVGDAVYSLYVRERLLLPFEDGAAYISYAKAADFQRAASKVVSAHGQSELLEKLIPIFTEEETDIFKRGRNAKKATKSKNASVGEYNRSTGFEAVLGYLYLLGREDRIRELLAYDDGEKYRPQEANTAFRPGGFH